MLVGVPKEIKTLEFRVGLTTGSVEELTHHGHQVIVETGAGEGVGLSDDMYRAAGAEIVASAAEIFERAEMIVKRLEGAGSSCWIAPRDIAPGQNYPDAIMDGLEECDSFLLVLSRHSNDSQHVSTTTDATVIFCRVMYGKTTKPSCTSSDLK